MTIFMGIRTKKFAFGAIDSRVTNRVTGDYEGYQPKMYSLDEYNITLATVGTVLKVTKDFRLSWGIKGLLSSQGKAASYEQVISRITNSYKNFYAKKVPAAQQDNYKSFVIIFGYNPKIKETFMYKCESPSFTPQVIGINEPLFLGAYYGTYKKNAMNILEQHPSLSKVNLQEWVKQTFDSVPNNPYVGYPLVLQIYKKKLFPWSKTATGDSFSGNSLKPLKQFNVNLKSIN